MQSGDECLTRGHFDMLIGGFRDQTANPHAAVIPTGLSGHPVSVESKCSPLKQ